KLPSARAGRVGGLLQARAYKFTGHTSARARGSRSRRTRASGTEPRRVQPARREPARLLAPVRPLPGLLSGDLRIQRGAASLHERVRKAVRRRAPLSSELPAEASF